MARAVIQGLALGTAYYAQIRARNSEEVSEWSRLFAFETENDTMPPKPITALEWAPVGTSFIATWLDPTENEDGTPLHDLKDIWCRIENKDGSMGGNFFVGAGIQRFEFTFQMAQQIFGRITVPCELRFTGYARDFNFNISEPTSQLATRPAPPPIKNLTAKTDLLMISLDWDAPDTTDISGYTIHESKTQDFAPDETTFRKIVTDTAYIYRTFDTDVHWFKVATVGLCGQLSEWTQISGIAEGIFNVDIEAPPQVENARAENVINNADPTGSNRLVKVTWDPIAVNDLAGYEIRYTENKLSMSTARTIRVAPDAISATISGLAAGADYYIQIRAVDYSSNYGEWNTVDPYPLKTTADEKPPNRPAPPTLAGSMAKIMVTHNLKDVDGAPLDLDLDHLTVYVGRTKDFVLDDASRVGTIIPQPPVMGIPAIQTFAYPVEDDQKDRWVVVVAVDTSGNESAPSDATQVLVDLIENTYIEDATIQAAKIGTLHADSIIAGQGIINNLQVYSGLTIGARAGIVSSDPLEGYIESQSYVDSKGTKGFHIDTQGVIIRDGSISARALEIQQGGNMVDALYASFEGHLSAYTGLTMPTIVNNGASISFFGKDATVGKFNNSSLHIKKEGPVVPGCNANIFFTQNLAVRNINVEVDTRYIGSIWINIPATVTDVAAVVKLCLYSPEFGYLALSNWTQVDDDKHGWRRLSGYFDATKFSKIELYLEVTSNEHIYIDGLQFEKKTGTTDTPSPWAPPGLTSISGSVITTGEIRSNATAWNHPSEPAWSINVDGDMHVGNAVVRGALVVGDVSDPLRSIVMSANYNASATGWIIDGYGNAEFNSATVRGIIHAQGGDFSGDVRVGNSFSNFIASQSWVYGGVGWMLRGDGYAEIRNARLQDLSVWGNITVGAPEDAGTALSQHYIKSANYDGVHGWAIWSSGYANFNSVDVRGTITASTISGSSFYGDKFATALPGAERMGFNSYDLTNGGPIPPGWDATQPQIVWASRFNTLNGSILYSTPHLSMEYYSVMRHTMYTQADGGTIGFSTTAANGAVVMDSAFVQLGTRLQTSGSATAVGVGSPNNTLYKISSSIRYKENVETLDTDYAILDAYNPVSFNVIDDLDRTRRIGLIAEELHESGIPALHSLVVVDDDGLPESIQYDRVGITLIPVIKKLKDRIEELENRLDRLK